MKHLLFHLWIVIASCGFCWSTGSNGFSEECLSWDQIWNGSIAKDSLEKFNCRLRDDCTGLKCNGKYQGSEFNVDSRIDPCKEPLSLDFVVSFPLINLTWSLRDGAHQQIPDFSSSKNKYLQVSLKPKGRNVTVGLELMDSTDHVHSLPLMLNKVILLPTCRDGKPVPFATVKLTTIHSVSAAHSHDAVESTTNLNSPNHCKISTDCKADETCKANVCSKVDVVGQISYQRHRCVNDSECNTTRKCDISVVPSGCKNGIEICRQEHISSTAGFCFCKANYTMRKHDCVQEPDPEKPGSISLALALVIPILILIICVVVAIAAFKLGLVKRYRDRHRGVRSYEIVAIGNDDDEPLVT